MTRNRASSKKAGSSFERQVAEYLAFTLEDDRIERRARSGSKDRGDISGLRHRGLRIVAECKNVSAWTPAAWLAEAEAERGNDDADIGLVIVKRRGRSWPGDSYVLMSLQSLAFLMEGTRGEGATVL